MCGIVGVIGNPKAAEIILEGLRRLEYRGYDSAGLAVLDDNAKLHTRKATGKLSALETALAEDTHPASLLHTPYSIGIGHTRWATHGAPSDANAHPHTGQLGNVRVSVVHNGIIENHIQLRETLTARGAQFQSQTDTETLPFSIASEKNAGHSLTEAVRRTAQAAGGSFAFVAMQEDDATQLVATRRGAPLCIGLSENGNFLCSDPLALAGLTNKFIFIEDGDVATLTPTTVTIHDAAGTRVERPTKTLDLSADLSGKAGFKHFMLKEIHEQPAVAARLLQTYTTGEESLTLPLTATPTPGATVNIVACGTAYYAGLVGKYLLEQHAHLPVNVDTASEFRYRNPPYTKGGIFIAVSQSGETADTLAALEHAKAAGQHIIALTNVPTSSIARAAHDVVDLQAGREIAVASTKAFTAMVLTLTLLSLQLGRKNGTLTAQQVTENLHHLRTLPALLTAQIENETPLKTLAATLTETRSMLYLGRGSLAPLAYEGSLKMKEISYIHAEGYASGEMKHGPIALVDKSLPVVNLASSTDGLFEKTLSNLKEVEARQGQVILITDATAATHLDAETRHRLTLIEVPTVPSLLAPLVFTIPLQLLAYHTAVAKGTDVDQPRNLAKSVTVE